ncbi:AtpZ/AtpI family protein [Nocardioides hwasunensis]|uniref:AtpZ/AtpI family protein n=1 Tax=Nocardioides hwasunensis TaxID=397258 RepID=A0ABR8MMI9_9ACTN|nr:AtpZ/AtpI family protein [Nocardioides hwasunensis]MBD3916035.1 AtpZ/AtpI family protein [Nocardioides hwasunensis]
MAESGASPSNPSRSSAPSYLVAGVLFYGFVGWLLDQWLGTRFLVAVGILAGGGLGTYMMIVQLRRQTEAADARDGSTSSNQTSSEESE